MTEPGTIVTEDAEDDVGASSTDELPTSTGNADDADTDPDPDPDPDGTVVAPEGPVSGAGDGTRDGSGAAPPERVTRIGGATNGSAASDRVTTGVIAADSTTRIELQRHQRWLLGGAALGLLVVLAWVIGATLSAGVAEDRARLEARVAAAEATFARAAVDEAEAYREPAQQVLVAAPLLRTTLEEHLVPTERGPRAIARSVDETTTTLLEAAAELERVAGRELPALDPLVDEDDRAAVLAALQQLRADAGALVEELRAASEEARLWSTAVLDLDAALAAHVAVVDAKPPGDDPETLASGWEAEREPLEALARQATTSAEVPGLERWATAHRTYAEGTLAFIDEAVPLLEDGDVEEYNALYSATFGGPDPFRFAEEARAGAEEALVDEPLVAVAELSARAWVVVQGLTDVERTVADRFADETIDETDETEGTGA